MNITGGLGIQSYCFRNFKKNEDVARMIKECGASAVELCGVHADFGKPETFAAAIAPYRAAGVAIVSIGVEGVGAEAVELEKRFVFALAAGARHMSISFKLGEVPACYRTAEQLAGKYGIRLAIHNHGGRHWLGSAEVLGSVFAQTNATVGLCLDTAWALHSHEDPVKMIETFSGRLYGLHLKDFVFNRTGKHEDVVVGTGNLDLPAAATALNAAKFDGYCVVEYEGDADNPVPALGKCVTAIKKAFAL